MRSNIVIQKGIVVMAMAIFAATSALASPVPPLRIVVLTGMNGFDPHAESSAVGLAILANIYDQLIIVDSEGRQTPILATNAERVGDLTWRFKLRQGVKFHNGAPFSSADVVASILRARDNPKSINRMVLDAVSEVIAEGPYAVRIELRKRDAIFLDRLSEIRITPKDSPATIVMPIGTGPYRYIQGQPNNALTLQAFDGYWGPFPSEKQIELFFDIDGKAGITRLLNNQADLVTNLRPEVIKDIETRDDLWVDSTLGNMVLFLVLNINQPPFDNSLVREAIDCAIDRQVIADQIFLKYARPASQIVTPSARGYAPSVPPVPRNIVRAKALVAAVAGEAGIPFTLTASTSREPISRLLAQQLAEAGFKVELKLTNGVQVLTSIHDGDIQMGIMAYRSPIPDAGSTYSYIFHSQSPGAYKTALSTPDIDRLIEASQDTLDPKARLALLYSTAERLAERRGIIPLVSTLDLYGARRELQWKPYGGWALPLTSASRQQARP